MNPRPPRRVTTTQQDQTYLTLRQWLSIGRFLPGERLKIKHLADELGVGVMPVRAALQRLAAEKALVNVPNAGVTVPQLSRIEFDDVLSMRLMLEGEAAERGVKHLTAVERKELAELSDEMAQMIADDDIKGYLDANERFHLVLYRAAGSPLLLDLIETVWLRIGPLSNRVFDDPHVRASMNDAHGDVLGAIDRGDAAAVRRGIERDLFAAGQFLKTYCKG
jgi:DNA-binding GntR family transcriptional regulator